ncbi:MAG TPA: zinc ribbon domain-containing protein [Patescibacteria group bacterium]|nr:zinc ribbon domain-containing protein [Patescibacteria group bacterium]
MENTTPPQIPCPNCQKEIPETDFYCPYCGKKIKEPPYEMTTAKKIGIYALSLILPPLGLWPAIRLLKRKEPEAKKIARIAIALTIISIIVSVWLSIGLAGYINKSINSQLNQYQDLGY